MTAAASEAVCKGENLINPILCVPSVSLNGQQAQPSVVRVFPETPAQVAVGGLAGYDCPASFRWSGDRRSVLVSGGASHPLVLCHYDETSRQFGPAQDLAEALGDPGVGYQIHARKFDWSNDGTKLIIGGEEGLTTFDLRTGARERVLGPSFRSSDSGSAGIYSVSFSPKAERVAFSVKGSDLFTDWGEKFQDLWLVNVQGTDAHRLGHGMFPSWAPDGASIIAISGATGSANNVLRYDLQMGQCHSIYDKPVAKAVYSPDGQFIAMYGRYRDHWDLPGIFLTDKDGRFQRVVATPEELPGALYPPRLDW